jgi:hypothetical protein
MESKMRQLRELEQELHGKIPREAYQYAWHFENLRRLTREISATCDDVLEAGDIVRGALDSLNLLDSGQVLRSALWELALKKKILADKDLSPTQIQLGHMRDCLVSLARRQERLVKLGHELIDLVTSAKLLLGESFALGLVRHCHEEITRTKTKSRSWELFCRWWSENDPNFPGLWTVSVSSASATAYAGAKSGGSHG